ncbi:MAG: hypothetical protein IJY00_02580 [Bacteroidaceae bacterium]|nr:hypothetical protein [Bacteroidaceae bacterium]
MKAIYACRFSTVFFSVLLLAALMLCASCRQAQPLPAVVQHTDSIRAMTADTVWRERVVWRTDSAARRDSVFVRETVRIVTDTAGRTVRTDSVAERYELHEDRRYAALQEQYRELEREYRALMQAYIDKRAEPYPVYRELTRWERAKMTVGGWAVGLLVLLAVAAVVWMIFKIKG